eukprot:6177764-Pleurochrysis_carterae.AAC.1
MRMRGKSGLNYNKIARHYQERFDQNPNMTVQQLHAVGVEIYGKAFSITNARTSLARLRGVCAKVYPCFPRDHLASGGRGLTDQSKLELSQALASEVGNHGLHVELIWATAAELRALLLQQVKQAAVKLAKTKAREAGQEYIAPRFTQKNA